MGAMLVEVVPVTIQLFNDRRFHLGLTPYFGMFWKAQKSAAKDGLEPQYF